MIRSIRYGVNVFVMLFIAWQIVISFIMIAQFPNCDAFTAIAWQQGSSALVFATPAFAFITIVNVTFRRRLEKQEASPEPWILLLFHVVIQLCVLFYMAYELKKHRKEF